MKWFGRGKNLPRDATSHGADPGHGADLGIYILEPTPSAAQDLNDDRDIAVRQTAEGEPAGHDESAGAPSPWFRTIRKIASWSLTAVFVGVLILAWPPAWGGKFSWTAVSGISMEQTFYNGDLVLSFSNDDYTVGDVIVYTVTFDDTTGAVIHRIVEVLPNGDYKTKGDNNDFIDPWVASPQNVRGEVIVVFPGAAKYVGLIRSPLFWIIPIGVMVAWFFWPAPELETPPGDDDADPEEDVDPQDSDDPDGPGPRPRS